MTRHSTIVGGSTADRLLNCPGSFQLIQRMPDIKELPSEYALYGSAMHEVMNSLAERFADGLPDYEDDMVRAAESLLGETFLDRKLEDHHLDDSIVPAIYTLYDLMREYGGGFAIVANELHVKFPSIPGAFGTADLLLANRDFVLMVDWKFGVGVPVKATYVASDGERVNPQLLFYFAGAMETLAPKIFTKKRFAVAIIQPRTEVQLTHTAITRTEVRMFIEDIEAAIVTALGKNPPLHMGEHCRWCPARPFCPEHTAPLFELAEFGPAPAAPVAAESDDGSYGEFLSKAKYLADLAAEYKKQVDEQVHKYLTGGGAVPGWKLKLKTKLRQWIDEGIVADELTGLGFGPNDIFQTKLQTFAVADKAAKRLGKKIPDHLRVAPDTDETVIAPESDPAPAVDSKKAAAELQLALKELLQGS